jgi:Family of unknown function (DUF6445)
MFNAAATTSAVPLGDGQYCHVIDGALTDPDAIVEWARHQAFTPPLGYPYPGLVLDAPPTVAQLMTEFFAQTVRGAMGARRTLDSTTRLSLVTVPPEELEPRQWQCHRDRIAANPHDILFAASVLYLFRDPALGGTSFYRPRQPAAQTDCLVADSQTLSAQDFSARYGLEPGYMAGSNVYFERIASVPAAWNRMIVYDGGLFHSADVERPERMSADPARGRLTLNGFFTCRRNAR